MLYFQDIIANLLHFWSSKGCVVHQGYDLEVGAGTFNPVTFLRCLGPEPYSAVYVEPSRRPKDGRYGDNPNRVQHYHQMQVILKPPRANIQKLYLESIESVGLKMSEHDIRFVHDDWENPTIGASGLGWEVWLDGMEVSQFTYFQSIGGLSVKPVTGEITYGLERLAMYLQGVDSIFDIRWNQDLTYGDIFHKSEVEWSRYNFEEADTALWFSHFDNFEKEARRLIAKELPLPAYDFVVKASHAFNILDARGVISVSERTSYITRIRNLAKMMAECYLKGRTALGFPLLRLVPDLPSALQAKLPSSSRTAGEREDFLLEIGTEELPASFVTKGLTGLQEAAHHFVKSHNLAFGKIQTYGTPRRLALYISDLQAASAPVEVEKRGPALALAFDKNGRATDAGLGFFRMVGAEPLTLEEVRKGSSALEIREMKGGEYLFAQLKKPSIATPHLLVQELPKIILSLAFPKKMRWESSEIEFARPIRWLVSLFGKEEVPFVLADQLAGRMSYGHRQLRDQPVILKEPKDYLPLLKEAYVMADVEERKKTILDELARIEKEKGCTVLMKEALIEEVVNLIEWPFTLSCEFDARFLKAPSEVLVSEMVTHQRNFPLARGDELLNHFVVVANNQPTSKMRSGYERALAPRLADGLFLYEEDLKTPLAKQSEKLANVTYFKDLGSLKQKASRLEKLSQALHPFVASADLALTKRAAALSKADLVTLVVGEFPELQGTIGRHYALKSGEDPKVALAIEESWKPKGEKDELPHSPEGILLSLAEKLDNLSSCFVLGLIPSSSSDPYALRRQALGLIRILIENKITLPLSKILEETLSIAEKNPEISESAKKSLTNKPELISQLKDFIIQRVRTVLAEMGFAKDEIEASLAKGVDDIYECYRLIEGLHECREKFKEPFSATLTVYYRAKKLLDAEKGKFKEAAIEPSLLKEGAEKALLERLKELENYFSGFFVKKERPYLAAFREIATLSTPLAKLFDEVRILDEDPALAANRLALLKRVLTLSESLADLSRIQEHAPKA